MDREKAQAKWDDNVRNSKIDRYYDDDGVLFLAIPLTGTYYKVSGSRVGDKRSIQEDRRINAGDQDAIRDERNRFLIIRPQQIVFDYPNVGCYCWRGFCSIPSFLQHPNALQKLRSSSLQLGRGCWYWSRRLWGPGKGKFPFTSCSILLPASACVLKSKLLNWTWDFYLLQLFVNLFRKYKHPIWGIHGDSVFPSMWYQSQNDSDSKQYVMNVESSFMWIFSLTKQSIQRGATHAMSSGSAVAKPKAKSGGNKGGRGNATRSLTSSARKGLETQTGDEIRVDGDDSDSEEGKGKKKKKSKKGKTDPLVAEKLSRLQVEKDLILTQEKWGGRVKILNQEVSESMASAAVYKQTTGFLGQICFSSLMFFFVSQTKGCWRPLYRYILYNIHYLWMIYI